MFLPLDVHAALVDAVDGRTPAVDENQDGQHAVHCHVVLVGVEILQGKVYLLIYALCISVKNENEMLLYIDIST